MKDSNTYKNKSAQTTKLVVMLIIASALAIASLSAQSIPNKITVVTLTNSVEMEYSMQAILDIGFEETKKGELILVKTHKKLLLTPVEENKYVLTEAIHELRIAKCLARDFITIYNRNQN